MREVQASEAGSRFAELLDAVERGENVVICRDGRRIARLVPGPERRRLEIVDARRQQEIDEAIEDLTAIGKEIREKHGPMPIEEILSLRHEGHKY